MTNGRIATIITKVVYDYLNSNRPGAEDAHRTAATIIAEIAAREIADTPAARLLLDPDNRPSNYLTIDAIADLFVTAAADFDDDR